MQCTVKLLFSKWLHVIPKFKKKPQNIWMIIAAHCVNMDCKLLLNRQSSVWSDKHVAKCVVGEKFKAALTKWGVSSTFRFCGRSGGLERELPFPELLPDWGQHLLLVIVASLVKHPASAEKQALPFPLFLPSSLQSSSKLGRKHLPPVTSLHPLTSQTDWGR